MGDLGQAPEEVDEDERIQSDISRIYSQPRLKYPEICSVRYFAPRCDFPRASESHPDLCEDALKGHG